MKLAILSLALAVVVLPAAALAGVGSMSPELGAKLAGRYEVPKGSPTGHGIVNLTMNVAKKRVCWTFELTGVGKPVVAHIYKAPPGKAGPIVVGLGTAYKAKGCTTAPAKTVEAIESNPNRYYVNVHTAKYPQGAVRGQLVAGMVHM